MAIITFHQFVENIEARRLAAKDTILGILKEKLHITDDDVILSMNTSDISDDVIHDLMARGVISNDPTLSDRIKNGMTIADLVASLSQS